MDAAPPPLEAPPPLPPRKKRRLWRWLFVGFGALLITVVALPHAIALDAVRTRVEAALSRELRAPCRIGRLGFSWLHGIAARDLVIGNPEGWTAERPALSCRRAAGSLGLVALAQGRLVLDGEVEGLAIHVEQDADGDTNLQRLFDVRIDATSGPSSGGGDPPPNDHDHPSLSTMQCNLQLRDASIEIRRDGRLLEAMTGITCGVRKAADSQQLAIDLDAKLQPTADSRAAGRLTAKVEHDLVAATTDAMLSAAGLDLQRYLPLLAMLWPDQLTALGGLVNGTLRATRRGDDLTATGEIVVTDPHIAGPLLHGMDVRGARWTFTPAFASRDGSLEHCACDLGFLQVRGKPGPAAGVATFTVELAVSELAAFGGPLPTWLRDCGAKLRGEVQVPIAAVRAAPANALTAITGDFELLPTTLAWQGFTLRDASGSGTLREGRFRFASGPSTRLDDGPFELRIDGDARTLDRQPATLRLGWRDGRLRNTTAKLLRYALPVLAGADVGLTGFADCEVDLQGPLQPAVDQNWLQWLDAWRGEGRLQVRDASFAPAGTLAGLLRPLGPLSGAGELDDAGRLAIDRIDAPFRFAQGAITTTATSWISKGKRIGLAGTVRLDGTLDYAVDLTALLTGHRDGERVLQAFGGTLPTAALRGTLDAPTLGLLDLGAVLQRLAQKELEQRGTGLLQRELERLLHRSPKR